MTGMNLLSVKYKANLVSHIQRETLIIASKFNWSVFD